MIRYAIRSNIASLKMWLVDPVNGVPRVSQKPAAGKWTMDRRDAKLYHTYADAEQIIEAYEYSNAIIEERLVSDKEYTPGFLDSIVDEEKAKE